MTLFKVALKNLFRKRGRSVTILLVAALASALMFGGAMIYYSVSGSMRNGVEKLGAQIMVVPAAHVEAGRKVLLSAWPTGFYMPGANLARIRKLRGVELASPQLFISSTTFQCCGLPSSLLVGYDPKTDFTITPWVVGRYAPWKGHEDLDPVSVGARLALTANRDLRFYGKQFRLGSLIGATGLAFIDNSIFIPMDAIRDMIVASKTQSFAPLAIAPDEISSILIRVGKQYDVRAVAREIESSAPGVKTIVTPDMIQDVRKDMEAAVWGILALGVLCWLMMLALLGLVFAMIVNERKREIGILRAMGAGKGQVYRLLLSEAALLSGGGAVAGVLLGLGVILYFYKLIVVTLVHVQFMWQSPLMFAVAAASCVGLVLLSGVLCAVYPVMKACSREPYNAIHQGK